MISLSIRKFFAIASAALVLCLGVFAPVQGQTTYFTETNKTVSRLGAANTSYVTFVEPLTQNCLWGIVYIAPEKKNLYIHLLAAKLSGKRLSRFDYSQPAGAGTQCNAELVEFTD